MVNIFIIVYLIATINLKSDPLIPFEKLALPVNEKETYVIFLSGLDSHCDGTPYNQMGFEYIRSKFNQVGLTYNDERFLMYSYTGGKVEAGRWDPNPYEPVDTGQPIQFSVMHLKNMIDEFTLHHPDARYVLVGHSLGGRIAFDYVIKYHLEKPEPIKGVITLNSPLIGISYYRIVNILATFRSVWGSSVVKQLAAEYQLRNELGIVEKRIEAARRMTEAGIYLATFGTRQDIVVNPLLSCLTDEYGYTLNRGYIISANLLRGVFKDLGSHMQILCFEKVANYIILVYCCPSDPTRTNNNH
ncbi:2-succinyl-6-hydroxy-2,4-cyclohexadiene-1-carboxylate synthase [Pelotomaculum propionicicum]|uniref:2-succinyl-6-hydroxy-2, 4-cyclohexadiene-1-carboxylate synthase n=1 Tax=Pelotomaculum propionicicum TaxID=258475 RepID=A0A4Y7RUT5_9FIRM|nr:alpha/beta fold hydrolase [Peptococcaceae bacterium]TEB12735.1 2-succinyl-6-hydroxy-2,4-cyclohexadiene-1-carboxylate synthase [Pelotomaculum propionicicum]